MEDIIIRGGFVIDGTGRPGFRADIAVRDGIITDIGDLSGRLALQVLDADGLTAAPGFIDAHTHSDTFFLEDDSGASRLYQGVTTDISGNCGFSRFPALEERLGDDPWHCASYADFLRKYERAGCRMGINQAMLVGHGSLREGVIGPDDHPPTPEELEQMKRLLRRDLETGAWGLSLGLEYSPGCFA